MLTPQLASPAEIKTLTAYIDSDDWVMEQKLDGHRVLLCSPGADMAPTALTRNGSIYTRTLPKAIRDFRFPPGEWVLDGELVDGTYWIFDLARSPVPGAEKADCTTRRQLLEILLNQIRHPFKIVPRAITRDEKLALAKASLELNFEGLILKRSTSLYKGGRSTDWLKVKYVVTADCIVTGVRTDGKESADLGLVDSNLRTVVDVGRCSLIGKPAVKNGDVVEVRYLYAGAGGRLFQPTLLKIRTDKTQAECTTDQMKHVDKTVMEVL